MKKYTEADIKLLQTPPSKEVVLKTMFGRLDVEEHGVLAGIFEQILILKASKIHHKRLQSGGSIFSSDTNWFLEEEMLKYAIQGNYVHDAVAGGNSLRIETCFRHFFKDFCFVDKWGLIVSITGYELDGIKSMDLPSEETHLVIGPFIAIK